MTLQQKTVSDGSAFEKLLKITELQGGDPKFLEDLDSYPQAKYSKTILADRPGYLAQINTMNLGFAGIQLGAGRRKISDELDYSSGLYIKQKLGNEIKVGDELLTIFSNNESALEEVAGQMPQVFTISDDAPELPPLIVERIS